MPVNLQGETYKFEIRRLKVKFKTLQIVTLIATCTPVLAFGSVDKDLAKAEHKMTKVCKKEFAGDLKGKNFTEVNSWVEKIEHGDKSDEFKKSKCYEAHENWEKVNAKKE
jgi:hypothetical protein